MKLERFFTGILLVPHKGQWHSQSIIDHLFRVPKHQNSQKLGSTMHPLYNIILEIIHLYVGRYKSRTGSTRIDSDQLGSNKKIKIK